jgi:hypothetical protein
LRSNRFHSIHIYYRIGGVIVSPSYQPPQKSSEEMQPEPIIYDDDTRYPGPKVHPPPEYITGIPTQRELDAQARMFTWGELKGIVRES